jgi:hypothetical protein
MAVTVAEEEVEVEAVSTAAGVVGASMEGAAMAVAAASAAARPPMAAIVAAASKAAAGGEACAADIHPRRVVPAQEGLGPSRAGEAAAAWRDPAERVLPTGSGTRSAAPTVRLEQRFDPLRASIVAASSHPLPGAVETGAAAVAVGDGADAGVGVAGAAVGDLALAGVSAGLPSGSGPRTGTTLGGTTIIPRPISTHSLRRQDAGYFAGTVVAGCAMSSRMLSISRVPPT